MLTQIMTELFKFKRSKVLWIIVLLIVLDCFSSYLQSKVKDLAWDEFLKASYMNLWIRPVFFSFLSGYLFTRDEEQHALSVLFTYPYHRSQWYFAKLAAAAAVIALLLLLSFAFELIFGLFLLSEPLTLANLGRQATFLFQTWLLYVALTPLAAFIAILVKKSILCAFASLGGGMISIPLGVISSKYITLSPWLVPYLYSYYPFDFLDYPVWKPGLLVSGILIVLSMGLGLYIYTQKDIAYE